MRKEILDDFTDLSGWIAVASGQARLTLSPDRGPHGHALRLDFDFNGGGGFVVARKTFALTLPETYAFSFNLRGVAPPNKFEFKLADPSNQNVWWYHRDAYDFPTDWRAVEIRNRDIEFAWGPAGSGPMTRVGALEFVIAAGPGGQGTVWLEDLGFTDLSVRLPPIARASSALTGHAPVCVLDADPTTSWRSEPSTQPQWLLIDFQAPREYGGLLIRWAPNAWARSFDLQTSDDAVTWETVCTVTEARGEHSYLYLPSRVSRYLRLNLQRDCEGNGYEIVEIDVKPFDFSRSINAFFQHIAQRERRGTYPRYWHGEQSYWTPVGIADGVTQALINEEGLVEVDQGSFSLEPFLFVDGTLRTWADAVIDQSLEQGFLPIPTVSWRVDDLVLHCTVYATGTAEQATLYIRYRLVNQAPRRQQLRLFVALRPLQVTPPWQSFKTFGGVSPITELSCSAEGVQVNGTRWVIPLTPPEQTGVASFAQGSIIDYLRAGELPAQTHVKDNFGYASAALRYDRELAPHATETIYLAAPFGVAGKAVDASAPAAIDGAARFAEAVRAWRSKLGFMDIHLPAMARGLVQSLKTAAAHILINRAGPALQPGPRRYTRSWMRDGAGMAAALLRMGWHAEVRDFIRWYARWQAADGNVPCAVDEKGADWLAEHDSHGQFIYTVAEYYRLSHDAELPRELWPALLRAVAYLEALRDQRLSPDYEAPAKRSCYGLLPESVSHEGYLAHPVHAYWDDFWALRGLKDAAMLAAILEDHEQTARLAALRDSFRETLLASLRTTMSERRIDFIPGSVEWADSDPVATAVAVTQVDESHHLPPAAVEYTFSEFLKRFRAMHEDTVPWTNYTPYEIRVIGALARLGRREDALAMAMFFMEDRRPLAWNQWPEIAWRDARTPGHLGDVPHTWIGAEYVLACCSLFAFERDADRSLVIAAGIADDWLNDGFEVIVERLPTYYGALSYRLSRLAPDTLRLTLDGDLISPPGGVIAEPPLPGPIVSAQVNGRDVSTFDARGVRLDAWPADVTIRCAVSARGADSR